MRMTFEGGGREKKKDEMMICNFYPLLFIYLFPPEANQSVARKLCREQEADQCCLTARASDVNRPAVKMAAFLFF